MENILNGATARVVLRYGIGFIVGAGWMSTDVGDRISNDPDVAVLVATFGAIVGPVIVEGWYRLAKRFGWPT